MGETTSRNEVARGFSSTAGDYDEVVRHNISGARRLIASIPDGAYDDVLDVGCGTGFASLAMIARFGSHRITGVDPAAGMLEAFSAKLGEVPDTAITLHEADVLEMPVAENAFDAVICSMAFHWFPRKPEALVAMAAPLRPGGHLAILCSGRGGEHEFRRILSAIVPPMPEWVAAFEIVQRDIPEMESYIEGAGLEPVDIWMERRIRRTPVEDYLERMRVVASHLHSDMPPDQLEAMRAQVEQATRAVSGPRGFEYTFTKLFAIARKPEA